MKTNLISLPYRSPCRQSPHIHKTVYAILPPQGTLKGNFSSGIKVIQRELAAGKRKGQEVTTAVLPLSKAK